MPSKILVVDLNKSSGKTTLLIGLTYLLKEEGIKTCPFKPLSVHNWFIDYSTTLENIKYGTIFCSDIIKLREVSECKQKYELLNPVDFLTTPLDPLWFIENNFSSMYYVYINDLLKNTVIIRTTIPKSHSLYNIAIVNRWLLEKNMAIVDTQIIERILSRSDQVIEFLNLNELEKIVNIYAYNSIKDSYQHLIESNYDIILIESFQDVAWPLTDNDDIDIIIGISPGVIVIYDTNRYKLALNIKKVVYIKLSMD